MREFAILVDNIPDVVMRITSNPNVHVVEGMSMEYTETIFAVKTSELLSVKCTMNSAEPVSESEITFVVSKSMYTELMHLFFGNFFHSSVSL